MKGRQRRSTLFSIALRFCALLPLLVATLAPGASVWAGGPVAVVAPGRYASWKDGRVNFVIDNGPLRSSGAGISRDVGANLVREVLRAWTDVPDSFVEFEDRGFLSIDVNVSNYERFIDDIQPEGNPVIFDANGAITNDLFGAGQSGVVLGFASSRLADGADDFYDYGFLFLNGVQATLSLTGDFRKTVLHEMGHLIGLDHTQAGLREFFSGPVANTPIMFPFIASNSGLATPRVDDSAWVSYLYPEPSFRNAFGTIRGRVTLKNGEPFQGANVVAVPVTTQPDGSVQLSDNGFVSVVSDFLVTFDGTYELPGIPPGDYAVFIEPILDVFTAGSGVGPFDCRITSFPRDYYNGAAESSSDDPTQMTVLHVAAGQVLSGIDFVSNDVYNFRSLSDDDGQMVAFENFFAFPFFGRLYRLVGVNSDGNLTFGGCDNSSAPRSEARFLTGFPRVAPLFTDLNVEEGGSITAEPTADSFRVQWTNVPEFAAQPGTSNTFSVTLFRSGDILFHYDQLSVTPDEAIQAIAGVTPGGGVIAGQTDLSMAGGTIQLNSSPIYQVFAGSTLDLSGSDILFEAAGSQLFLFFPLNEADVSNFTGFAVTNDDQDGTILDVEALTTGGQRQAYPDNPHLEFLGGGRQLARLGSDFFGLTGTENQDGWVRIGSTGTNLASFSQFGNGLGGSVTRLDGSTAFTETATEFFFTRLYDGPASFPALNGAQTSETVLAIANPGEQGITVELTLFDGAGNQVAAVSRDLGASGSLRETVSALFGQAVVSNGFVRARVAGGGAVGFELVRLSDTLLGFNASTPGVDTVSYSAQLASGTSASGTVFTSIKLVNVSGQERTVTLRALADDGTPLAAAVQRTLQPNQSLQEDAGELFGLGSAATAPAVQGSLRVESSGPGVVGDVVFGDPTTLRYAAALPLQTRLLRRAIFSQVANANTGGGNAANITFTGLAFHNPNAVEAQIVVTVFAADGTETGSRLLNLSAGRRTSNVLTGLIPSTAGQIGGYIVVQSTQPIVAQQLFGNLTLDYLSAVPPTIFN